MPKLQEPLDQHWWPPRKDRVSTSAPVVAARDGLWLSGFSSALDQVLFLNLLVIPTILLLKLWPSGGVGLDTDDAALKQLALDYMVSVEVRDAADKLL